MLRRMAFPVLARVEQRRERRRRVRLRRLAALLVVAAAAGSGAWFGHDARHAAAVPLRAQGVARTPAAPASLPARLPARERLVAGAPLLRHRFSPRLGAASAILVDASSGRV